VTPAAGSLTLKAGTKVSDVISFSAQGGFSSAISLTCSVSGVSPAPVCGISPNSVNPGSSATLMVDASGISAVAIPQIPFQVPNLYPLLLPLTALAFVVIASLDPPRRRAWLLTTTILLLSLLPAACGTASGPPPPVAKVYSVTVTATSGAIEHSTVITVTVN